jgi:hypothetical protein
MLVLLYLDIRHASNRSKCELRHIKSLAIGNSQRDPAWCQPAARGAQESCVSNTATHTRDTIPDALDRNHRSPPGLRWYR